MILQFDPYLIFLYTFLTPGCKRYVMQQYLTYICTDINETGPSLVIFLWVDQFCVLRFLFCRVYVLSKHKKNITICHLKINIFTAVTYRNIFYGRVIVMHVETAGLLFDMRRSRKFSREGGGVTIRPGWVQLHTSGVVINLSKCVDHGIDSYFWYIQRPEQDFLRWRSGAVVRASDFGPRGPWLETRPVHISLWPWASQIYLA